MATSKLDINKIIDRLNIPILDTKEPGLNPEIIKLISDIMIYVEELKIDGALRKKLVIDILEQIVNKSSLDDNNKFLWIAFIRTIVPGLIESLISLSKGVNIENVKNSLKKCFPCC